MRRQRLINLCGGIAAFRFDHERPLGRPTQPPLQPLEAASFVSTPLSLEVANLMSGIDVALGKHFPDLGPSAITYSISDLRPVALDNSLMESLCQTSTFGMSMSFPLTPFYQRDLMHVVAKGILSCFGYAGRANPKVHRNTRAMRALEFQVEFTLVAQKAVVLRWCSPSYDVPETEVKPHLRTVAISSHRTRREL